MANSVVKNVTDKNQIVNINSPVAVKKFANDLKQFIVENELYTPIRDKNYVNVEGWQFAGFNLGILPVVVSCERVDEDLTTVNGKSEFKYRAEVRLIEKKSGETIGYGVAVCSNAEDRKKTFDEYAVASMAQTRAVGKAFRLTIGWVMKLAGYEATPKEEIDNTIIEAEAIEVEPEIAFDEVKSFVDAHMESLDVTSKLKFMKQVGRLSEKTLVEGDYRRLYLILSKEQEVSNA